MIYYLKYPVPFVFLFFIAANCFSQNLVPNPSFENAWYCPDSYTKEYNRNVVPDWFVPNTSTPDYFNACATVPECSVPQNFAGKAMPKNGNGYLGLILKDNYSPENIESNKDYFREYISAKLTKPLKAGKLYCVSFYYRLADSSSYAVDGLGLFLSKSKVKHNTDGVVKAKPQLFNKKDVVMANKEKWHELGGIYQAKGGEKFITIGNFLPTKDLAAKLVDSLPRGFMNGYSYYYIDDVRVFAIDNDFECACGDKNSVSLYVPGADLMAGKDAKNKSNKSTAQENKNSNTTDKNNLTDKSKSEGISGKNSTLNGIEKIDEAEAGMSVILNHIYFDYNSSQLKPESYPELDVLVEKLANSTEMKIEVAGHSDITGTEKQNQKLSELRARAVVDYLRLKGIKKKRLSYIGYGNTRPIADNTTDEGRQKNRRVEIFILEK